MENASLITRLTRPPGPLQQGHRLDPAAQHQALVKQSQRLVSQAFFGTLLKQIHNSPFKSDLFDGGRGGQAFTSMLDQRLADRMARGAGRRLVDTIVRKIESKSGGPRKAAPRKNPPIPRAFERTGYIRAASAEGRADVAADYRA